VSVRAPAERALAGGGRVDILVDNADVDRFTLLADVTEEAFDRIYAVNVKAVFFLAKSLVPAMVAGKGAVESGTGVPPAGCPPPTPVPGLPAARHRGGERGCRPSCDGHAFAGALGHGFLSVMSRARTGSVTRAVGRREVPLLGLRLPDASPTSVLPRRCRA